MNAVITVGIDNGLKGGLCALQGGQILDAIPMPLAATEDRPDLPAVLAWLKPYAWATIALEEPLEFAKTLATMRSMMLGFGMLYGSLTTAGFQVDCISVRAWQRAILGRVPKGQTKLFALRRAQLLWPAEKWLATPRSRTPHDGMIDAALIAYYSSKL